MGTHSIFIYRPTDVPHTVYATALQGAPTAEHAIAQAMPKVADCLSNEELIALEYHTILIQAPFWRKPAMASGQASDFQDGNASD